MYGDKSTNTMNISCRLCGSKLEHLFADLGMSPLCERFITKQQLNDVEHFYPLKVFVCEKCLFVQLDEYVSPDKIFNDYAYFSSSSDSWVKHAKHYSDMVIKRFGIGQQQLVMELASNDGYLLRHFKSKGIPILGVEPAANVAQSAIDKGIPTVIRFFGEKSAHEIMSEHGQTDLLVANNVLAHVPDLNDFIAGMKVILKPSGIITLEFPHLFRLMEQSQFDTIYHEHFSYFSLITAEKAFAKHGLRIFDVEELPSHGGSIRIYVCHRENKEITYADNVSKLKAFEVHRGFDQLDTYLNFQNQIEKIKRNTLELLIQLKQKGNSIVAYGAPGKGNTFLNYCGIREDFVDYAVDRTAYKHGKYTPGTHIPIYAPEKINETQPDYLIILPWNLKKEITNTADYVRNWGGKFIVFIPETEII